MSAASPSVWETREKKCAGRLKNKNRKRIRYFYLARFLERVENTVKVTENGRRMIFVPCIGDMLRRRKRSCARCLVGLIAQKNARIFTGRVISRGLGWVGVTPTDP